MAISELTNQNKYENKANEAVNKLKSMASDFSADAQDKAYEFGETVRHKFEDVKSQMSKGYDEVEHYVKEKPIASVGIALITGLLLGKLFFNKK